MFRHRSSVPLPVHGRDHIRYAAAYIHSSVRRVWIEDGAWWVETSEHVDHGLIDAGLARLTARFGNTELPDPASLFAIPLPAGAVGTPVDQAAFRQIIPGLFVLRPPYSDLLRFVDWAMLARFARPFKAREETYPNVIPVELMALTNHLTAFPEHLHFVSHLTEDLGVLDSFATRMRVEPAPPQAQELATARLVHNPSTCYHCYASRQGAELDDNEVVTAVTRCHRFESANHSDPGRLMEFALREVIFVGDPDFVRSTRLACLDLIRDWAEAWGLAGELMGANDPFFTDDYTVKASHQHRMAMKYEFRAVLPDSGRTLAVLSSNLHSATFGKSFDITVKGRRANTGCIGFGLERLVLALTSQHGTDPACWPKGLRADYQTWQAADPLSP